MADGYITDEEHWATYPEQPQPVQRRMVAVEQLRRLREAADESLSATRSAD